MHLVHAEISNRLPGLIDGFYFCPHLPDDDCRCRKPNLGMIEDAVSDRSIDLFNSWIIGDKSLDVRTGVKAGIRTAMVRTGYGAEHERLVANMADIIADDLGAAAKQIDAILKSENVILVDEKPQLVTPEEAPR
jgi:D-glycero-D-manno-heptose 1,7-bisphosphate phosphatase